MGEGREGEAGRRGDGGEEGGAAGAKERGERAWWALYSRRLRSVCCQSRRSRCIAFRARRPRCQGTRPGSPIGRRQEGRTPGGGQCSAQIPPNARSTRARELEYRNGRLGWAVREGEGRAGAPELPFRNFVIPGMHSGAAAAPFRWRPGAPAAKSEANSGEGAKRAGPGTGWRCRFRCSQLFPAKRVL